jgi:hypothetical protein
LSQQPGGEQWPQFAFLFGAACATVIVARIPFPGALSTLKSVSTFSRKD